MPLLLRAKHRLCAIALVLVLGIVLAPSLRAQSQDFRNLTKTTDLPGNGAKTLSDDAKAQEFRDLIARISKLDRADKSAEAIPLAEQAVALARATNGEEHVDFAKAIDWLGSLLRKQGRFDEAAPLLKRALAIREKMLPAGDPRIASTLNGLGELYREQSRLSEAEAIHKRALAMRERALPEGHGDIVVSVNNLAVVYREQGRYADAEPLLKRALAIREKMLPSGDPRIASTLNNLGELYREQSRLSEAEAIHKRALAMLERALPEGHSKIAGSVNNLALVYQAQGRYAEAEPLRTRALAIAEKAYPQGHPVVATALNNLAEFYRKQGRIWEAEALHKRALAMREKALPKGHADIAVSVNNLALVYEEQRRYAEAEPLRRRALSILETAFPGGHPLLATALDTMGGLYVRQGRHAEAEPFLKRALAMREKVLPEGNPQIAENLANLAVVYALLGRHEETEPLHRRALAIFEKAYPPNHPHIAASLANLAMSAMVRKDWSKALAYARRSTEIQTARGQHANTRGASNKGEIERGTNYFRRHVQIAHRAGSEDAALREESYAMAQWALRSDAAAALAKVGARYGVRDDRFAQALRARQDIEALWVEANQSLTVAVANSDAALVDKIRDLMATLDRALADFDVKMSKKFPEFSAITESKPLSIAETQALLQVDEALLQILLVPAGWRVVPAETFAWLITKTEARWARLKFSPSDIQGHVDALRCGLDAALWQDASGWPEDTETNKRAKEDQIALRKWCRETMKVEPARETVKAGAQRWQVDVLPFDAGRAHALYKALFEPFADLTAGRRLLVIADGNLTTLPFNVLVATPPRHNIPAKLADYRRIAWLGARQPVAVLPSIASLKSLRTINRQARPKQPFLGIGNPLLDGRPHVYPDDQVRAALARTRQGCRRQERLQHARAAAAPQRSNFRSPSPYRGADVDIELIRQWSALPETADELCDVAGTLGVPDNDVLLGASATETKLKELSDTGRLAEYEILHFATHGALAGQVEGEAEPGLILTPPDKATTDRKALDRDDGLLTASEIALLRTNADWVVLSACNTAGASAESGDALSGMARAFFYAGARALLVSHWEVASDAAVKLTTRAFAELKARPTVGRAEAFRVSMQEMIRSGRLWEAHPSQWAPFVLVGVSGSDTTAAPLTTGSTSAAEPAKSQSRPRARKRKPASDGSWFDNW